MQKSVALVLGLVAVSIAVVAQPARAQQTPHGLQPVQEDPLATITLANGVGARAQDAPNHQLKKLIESLREPGDGLRITQRSSDSFPTFAVAVERGILLDANAAAPASDRARRFIELYGAEFGLTDPADVRLKRAERADAVGVEHVRLQQLHQGVAVTAGEWIVHMKGARVVGTNGKLLHDLPDNIVPSILPDAARVAAAAALGNDQAGSVLEAEYSKPRLELFNRGMLEDGTYPTRLAWFIEARGPSLREFIWIDATTGGVLLHFSQLPHALNRRIYTANYGATLPGTLLRTEGGPATGIASADFAYEHAGDAYSYYFTQHGRDSYDNHGAPIISSIRYRDCRHNAFWNGTQMVYCDGFTMGDDVVGHELTHAVTEFSARLFLYQQSGALNESFSDIFGESVDQTNGRGNDTAGVRWLMGEDLPDGAFRNMMTGYPGRVGDGTLVCSQDGGSEHANSAIPSHAYALMVDGGTFNGQTITGIGLAKAGAIQYRALTTYLTSGSNFIDNAAALGQSCTDLIGSRGITAADCSQVTKAIAAVEMTRTWACTNAVTMAAPPLCPVGQTPNDVFNDNFERTTAGNWTVQSQPSYSYAQWSPTPVTGFAKSGTRSAFGSAGNDSALAMTVGIELPAGARLQFNHAFSFFTDSFFDTSYYSGGVVEYSTNDGATWTDAGSFYSAGMPYQDILWNSTPKPNPIGVRPAFVNYSVGYTATQLNLAALAGTVARFRFRIGHTGDGSDPKWWVDDVRIYTCAPAPHRDLAFDFGPSGLWLHYADAGWRQLNPLSPAEMASGDVDGNGQSDLILDFPGQGVWMWLNDSQWLQLHTLNAPQILTADLDGNRRSAVLLDFPGLGIWVWRYNVGWSQLNSRSPHAMTAGDLDGNGRADVLIDFPGIGVWVWANNQTWSQLNVRNVTSMTIGDLDGNGQKDVLLDFPGAGIWIWGNNTSWAQLHTRGASLMTTADLDGSGPDEVIIDFTGYGLWVWRNGPGWSRLLERDAEGITPADLDSNGRSDLVIDFGAAGLWVWWNDATWAQWQAQSPEGSEAGIFYWPR